MSAGAFICGGPLSVDEVQQGQPAPEHCPRCGGQLEMGYGLMGGGIGTYWCCVDEHRRECDWMGKRLDPGDDDSTRSSESGRREG